MRGRVIRSYACRRRFRQRGSRRRGRTGLTIRQPHARVQFVDLGQVVGPQWGNDRVGQEPSVGIEQAPQVGDGESAARLRGSRLAEGGLQFGGVGHREVRTIDQEEAVPVPARPVAHLLNSLTDLVHQGLPDGLRQPSPGWAVGRSSERLAAEVR